MSLFFHIPSSLSREDLDEARMTNADGRMNKILSKHFMDPEDVVVKKDEPEAL